MKNIVNSKRRSKRSRRVNVTALVALAAIVVAAVALLRSCGGHERPQALATAIPTATPSPRPRAWSAGERARLRTTVGAALAPGIAGARRWSEVVLDGSGNVLYADRANRAAVPASTMKLIVASTALDVLGPQFRYHTLLASPGALASDGTLGGNLYLEGSGDPSLTRDDLRAGVGRLANMGLHEIDGGAVVDATAIGGPEMNPLWNAGDANEDFESPISGISLDQDTVEFHVIGAAPGAAATVTFLPFSAAVHVAGSVMSTGADTPSDVIVAAMEDPNHFVVSGHIPAGVEEKYWVPVHGIPAYAGAVLDRMLLERGIAVAAPARVGRAPHDAAILWNHRSKNLRALVRRMLFESNNHFAEQLLRTVAGTDGPPTTKNGIRIERALLARLRVSTREMVLVDGSGLAHANRVPAIALAKLLSDAQARGDGVDLYDELPEGGKQGTLQDYPFTTALGRVRAKTGHVFGVCALAGYVNTERHGRIVFAFIVNGSPGDPDAGFVQAVDRLAAM